jgi:hypothetical protein
VKELRLVTKLEEQARLAARNGVALQEGKAPGGIITFSETPAITPAVAPEVENEGPLAAIDFAKLLDAQAQAPKPEVEAKEPDQTTEANVRPAPAAGFTKPALCPHCGWDHTNPDVSATAEDKQEFVRSILGNRPFTKDYPLYGGKLTLRFQQLRVAVEDLLGKLLREEVDAGTLDRDAASIASRRDQFRMVMQLVAVKLHGKWATTEIPTDAVSSDRLTTQWNILSDSLNSGVIGAAWAHSQHFTALVSHLTAHADDESFWQGLS